MLLAFFIVLVFLYSLFSSRLRQTVVTAPIFFTIGGMILILARPDLTKLDLQRHLLLTFAEIALVMLLFTDASRITLKTLQNCEWFSLRLLSIGMLLTIVLGTLSAKVVFPGLSIWEAGILAAILAPTDAGLGQVIVQSPQVPARIRRTLDIEAGLNDGLSVPFLMTFIAISQIGTDGASQVLLRFIYEQLGLGVLVGLAIGLGGGVLLGLAQHRKWMDDSLKQIALVTLPILCILACEPLGGSMFIAAYVAGLSVRVGFGAAAIHSGEFAEGWGQLFDYFVFFLFGLLATRAFGFITWIHVGYAILSLTLVRMIPVAIALIGSRLSTSTVLFMGWFGPRGLASIVLGLVFLEEAVHLPGERTIQLAVIATVLVSIFAHGLTAQPGINLYARKVSELEEGSPELQTIGE